MAMSLCCQSMKSVSLISNCNNAQFTGLTGTRFKVHVVQFGSFIYTLFKDSLKNELEVFSGLSYEHLVEILKVVLDFVM